VKSIKRFASQALGVPLLADDILEFHTSRLLLLFRICGTANRIDGLTKMAKLDFFVRYPDFFNRVIGDVPADAPVESSMTRFHYGPWDHRYYQLLAVLESRGLISAVPKGRMLVLTLTPEGQATADRLRAKAIFGDLVQHMSLVKRHLGGRTGSSLKTLIYKTFRDEVAHRALGEEIK
jgi:hypothetical protein